MNDPGKKIELTFRREDFEEIYFKDRQESIYLNETIKPHFISLFILLILLISSLYYYYHTNELPVVPIILSCIFLIQLIVYIIRARVILKWKNQVTSYINSLAKINKHSIFLSEESLTIIQDNETIISKWIVFTKATINDESILLFGNDNYVFPKKSMGIRDYEYLKNFISSKFQNGL